MPVMLDQSAKKALVKTIQTKANKHFNASDKDRLKVSQVGEWVAEALGFDDQNDLVAAIQSPQSDSSVVKSIPIDGKPELERFARNATEQLIGEIKDSALGAQEGWISLLVKFADLCQSIYLVDSPAHLKREGQWIVSGDELIEQARQFFLGRIATEAQTYSDMRGQLSEIDRRAVDGLLMEYENAVLKHGQCNSLVTCVPDHTNAMTIRYRMVVENTLNDDTINPYRSLPVMLSIASGIENYIRPKRVSENPELEIGHAIVAAFEIAAEKIRQQREAIGRPVYPERECPVR